MPTTRFKVLLANVDGPNLMGANPLTLSLDLPLGLGAILARLAQDPDLSKGCDAEGRSYAHDLPTPEVAAGLLKERPDAVAFTAFTWNLAPALRAAEALKAQRPSTRLVFGGPCVPLNEAGLRRFMTEHPCVDVAVSGEGEETFLELARTWLDGGSPAGVAGTAFREGSDVVVNPARPPSSILASFPSPFLTGKVRLVEKEKGVVPLETSRGCPLSCSFCDFHRSQKRIRKIPLERVTEELRLLESWGFRGTLYITDPLVNADPVHFKAVLDACSLSSANLFFNPHAEMFDEESIDKLGRIPIVSMALGVQSINPAAMRAIGRPCDPARITANLARLLRLPNLNVSLDLIVGLPGDDFEGFKRTLDWAFSFDPIPLLAVHHLGIPEDAPLAKTAVQFGITAELNGFAQETATFSGEDLRRASWLCRVVSHFQKTPAKRVRLRELVRASRRRPSQTLESMAEAFLKQGRLSSEPVGAFAY